MRRSTVCLVTCLAACSVEAVPQSWNDVEERPEGLADGIDDDVLAGLSCADGQVAKRLGGAWTCADDEGIVELRAGAGLTGGTVTDNGELAVDFERVAERDHGHAWGEVASRPAGLDDGDDDTLGGLACTDEQVALRSGGAWVCAEIPDVLAAIGPCAEGSALRYVGGEWTCAAAAAAGCTLSPWAQCDPVSALGCSGYERCILEAIGPAGRLLPVCTASAGISCYVGTTGRALASGEACISGTPRRACVPGSCESGACNAPTEPDFWGYCQYGVCP